MLGVATVSPNHHLRSPMGLSIHRQIGMSLRIIYFPFNLDLDKKNLNVDMISE